MNMRWIIPDKTSTESPILQCREEWLDGEGYKCFGEWENVELIPLAEAAWEKYKSLDEAKKLFLWEYGAKC